MRELLEKELIPKMMAVYNRWDYCGNVADWVVGFLMQKGFNDAWQPPTNGHQFALVCNNSLIVDLWEPDGTLKVKLYPANYGQTDPDYTWFDVSD